MHMDTPREQIEMPFHNGVVEDISDCFLPWLKKWEKSFGKFLPHQVRDYSLFWVHPPPKNYLQLRQYETTPTGLVMHTS